MANIKEILQELGYKPKDFGLYYRCAACYRGGVNESSMLVHKDSGVFIDYGSDNLYLPFSVLIERTVGKENAQQYLNKVSLSEVIKSEKIELLSEEKIYPKQSLNRLLPNYEFYKKKHISEKTQTFYKCGLATQRFFYKRIVFPIFRSDGQIHGFSGRTIQEVNGIVKWIHKGKKSKWIYPAFLPQNGALPCLDSIKERGEVFIVESIGDSMALYENGIPNNLVAFGLSISPSLSSFIASLGLRKIIIAFNEDGGQKDNNGENGLVKEFLSMLDIVDFNCLYCAKPMLGDFGEMAGTNHWDSFLNSSLLNDHKASCDFINNKISKLELPASYQRLIKKFRKLYKFHYGE